jgi:ABC-type transport system involved in multi-copper enzyme maturation permease subunit
MKPASLIATAHIARHELARAVRSPGSWVVSAAFLALHGALFALLLELDAAMQGAAQEGALTTSTSVISAHAANCGALVILFAPLLTQGLLADDERGAGVLLLGAPVRSGAVVTGKWLGGATRLAVLIAVAQIPAWVSPTMLGAQGPTVGWLAATLVLFSGAAMAIGTLASAISGRRATAAVLAWAALLALWTVGRGPDGAGLGAAMSLGRRFDEMARGIADLGDLGYLVGLTIASLAGAAWALEARRWR